jgi:hypothetical protein
MDGGSIWKAGTVELKMADWMKIVVSGLDSKRKIRNNFVEEVSMMYPGLSNPLSRVSIRSSDQVNI